MELHENTEKQERALLVAVDTGSYDVEASLAELYELTKTAGAEPFGAMTQKRPAYETATCVGSGMVQEIADICQKQEIDLLIFDCELSPTQIRNIEDITNVRVIDRTMLILDIFAARAVSKEGKLQVELAQLKYMLPRLTGKGTALSRLGGGIGTRGPGETKLETDKRHIHRRIDALKEQLEQVEKHREQINRRRKKDGTVTTSDNSANRIVSSRYRTAIITIFQHHFAVSSYTSNCIDIPCDRSGVITILYSRVTISGYASNFILTNNRSCIITVNHASCTIASNNTTYIIVCT